MADARDIVGAYRDGLRELRRYSGPAGQFLAPLELVADALDQGLNRQSEIERQINGLIEPITTAAAMARDAPRLLRAQAQAFEAASVSFKQAADVLNLQADLLERTMAAVTLPASLLQRLRPPGGDEPGDGS